MKTRKREGKCMIRRGEKIKEGREVRKEVNKKKRVSYSLSCPIKCDILFTDD